MLGESRYCSTCASQLCILNTLERMEYDQIVLSEYDQLRKINEGQFVVTSSHARWALSREGTPGQCTGVRVRSRSVLQRAVECSSQIAGNSRRRM